MIFFQQQPGEVWELTVARSYAYMCGTNTYFVPRDKAWDERKRVSFPRGIPQGNPLDPDPRFRRVTL